uniref:Secreted protein n=1 Tax=Schistocephalus solidus TaxID=70667 RepID=A0A0X3NXE6_SCHSO
MRFFVFLFCTCHVTSGLWRLKNHGGDKINTFVCVCSCLHSALQMAHSRNCHDQNCSNEEAFEAWGPLRCKCVCRARSSSYSDGVSAFIFPSLMLHLLRGISPPCLSRLSRFLRTLTRKQIQLKRKHQFSTAEGNCVIKVVETHSYIQIFLRLGIRLNSTLERIFKTLLIT